MEPVDLFYSYAHEDEPLRDELAGHLKIMERRGVIRPWHDRCILPGQKWDQEIDHQLASADLVLLLISKDFINSDYIWGHELETAMQRQNSGKASVVPVMLRAVDIAGAPFADLQGLPTDLRPVTSWPNRDEAWTDVAKGIRRSVEQIQAHWAQQAPSAPASSGFGAGPAPVVLTAPMPMSHGEEIPKQKPSAGAAEEIARDPLLVRVVNEFSASMKEATYARRGREIDAAQMARAALALIDATEQKRVLWVDDRPDNNRLETAALAKLQIEVVHVTSTDAAMTRIAEDPEAFDLVLSDWDRSEPLNGAPSAGIHLLRTLRQRHLSLPVVFYHGCMHDPQQRQARHELALREGAFGEAVMPGELLERVVSAFGLH